MVKDLVDFSRSQGIYCQIRGSGADSAVCRCIGLTRVDPIRLHLPFERFLSEERGKPPDIDIDFEADRREEVIQYCYRRYGRERAAMVANVITYRAKSVLRDVAKTFGFSPAQVDGLSKYVDSRDAALLRDMDAPLPAGDDCGDDLRHLLASRRVPETSRNPLRGDGHRRPAVVAGGAARMGPDGGSAPSSSGTRTTRQRSASSSSTSSGWACSTRSIWPTT